MRRAARHFEVALRDPPVTEVYLAGPVPSVRGWWQDSSSWQREMAAMRRTSWGCATRPIGSWWWPSTTGPTSRCASLPRFRLLPGYCLPGHPSSAAASRAGVGAAARRGCRTVVDRGRNPRPGPRPQGRRVLPQLSVLSERAGHHRCGQPPGDRLSPPLPRDKADAHA